MRVYDDEPLSRLSSAEVVRDTLQRATGAESTHPKQHTIRVEEVPIPSIEDAADFNCEIGIETSTAGSCNRTPSMSLTPPERDGATESGRVYENIDNQLADLNLSDRSQQLDMSDMATAIGNIGSSVPRLTSHDSLAVSTPTTNRRRSRSSISRQKQPRHEVRDEEQPDDRLHDPAFQRAFSDAKRVVLDMATALASSDLHKDPDSAMQRLYETAYSLAEFRSPLSRKIGFVGDSGVGKSSLLNALLDCSSLAGTNNSGAACTCVATEYHYHEDASFVIEVELLTEAEINNQIYEYLLAYRSFHILTADPESNDRRDRENVKDLETAADVAIKAFRSAFGRHLPDEEFLLQPDQAQVLRKLQRLGKVMRPSDIRSRQVLADFTECSQKLTELTTNQESKALKETWFFIKSIKVHSNAHILSQGLVLVDLPGLRDQNAARQNVTELYIRQCDEIFAVCTVGRATSDVGLWNVLELARKANLPGFGIVCTKTDDIRPLEYMKSAKLQVADRIQDYLDQLKNIETELSLTEEELLELGDEELTAEEKDDQIQLFHQERKLTASKEDCEFRLKAYIIEDRNQFIKGELKKKFPDNHFGSTPQIFCVSRDEYFRRRDSPKDQAWSSLDLSGIIQLRKHCISIVSSHQFRVTKNFIENEVPALLGDIALWVQSGSDSANAERKEALRSSLNSIETQLKKDLTGSEVRQIGIMICDEFKEVVFSARNYTNWTKSSSEACRIWGNEFHAQSYIAFCRKYGKHRPKDGVLRVWNEEIIARMVTDLQRPWATFLCMIQNLQSSLMLNARRSLKSAVTDLENNQQDDLDSLDTLIQVLTSRQYLLIHDLEEKWRKFTKEISQLEVDAFSDIPTAFIGGAMHATYQAAQAESGPGCTDRKKLVMGRRLRDENLFSDIMADFEASCGKLAMSLQESIMETSLSHLSIIRNTLNMIRDDNVTLESEKDPQFRIRVQEENQRGLTEIRRIVSLVSVEE